MAGMRWRVCGAGGGYRCGGGYAGGVTAGGTGSPAAGGFSAAGFSAVVYTGYLIVTKFTQLINYEICQIKKMTSPGREKSFPGQFF